MYTKRGGVAAYHTRIIWSGLCLRSVPGVRVPASAVDDSSLYRLSYPAHFYCIILRNNYNNT